MKATDLPRIVIPLVLALAALALSATTAVASWEDFGRRVDRELVEMRAGLERVAERAGEAGEATREALRRKVEQARERWQLSRDEYERYVEIGEDATDEMRDGLEEAMEELREAYEDAWEELNR